MRIFNKKGLIEIEKYLYLYNLYKYDGFNLIYMYK